MTVCQDFMNSATTKYNNIVATEGSFKELLHTIQEDIVALFSEKKPTKNSKHKPDDYDEDTKLKRPRKGAPPWISHFKNLAGVKYKIRDAKEFNGTHFHFCDAPTHHEKLKWCTHKPEIFRVRKLWIQKQEEKNSTDKAQARANVGEQEEDAARATILDITSGSNTSDVHALLASAINLVADNNVVRDFIAEAMNAANHL